MVSQISAEHATYSALHVLENPTYSAKVANQDIIISPPQPVNTHVEQDIGRITLRIHANNVMLDAKRAHLMQLIASHVITDIFYMEINVQ